MIYKAWADSNYAMPDIIEKENPDRVCFTLPVAYFSKVSSNEHTQKVPVIDKAMPDTKGKMPVIGKAVPDTKEKMPVTKEDQKLLILSYIQSYGEITANIASNILNVKVRRARAILYDMQAEGCIKKVGLARKTKYILNY